MLTKPIVKSLRFSIGGANRGDCVVETVPAMKPEDAIHEQRAYFFGSKFSLSIEEMYCQEIILDGAKSVVLNMILACFLFNGFLFSDYFITGSDFKTYCVFRLLVATPVAICIIYLTNKRDKYYQTLISTFPLVASTSQSILIFLGHGNYRLSYLYGLIIVCICSFVITRPRVPYAIASVLSQFAIYLVTLHLADCDADVSRLVGTLYGLSGCAVTLMAAYALERISHRAFLLNLRVRLLNQKLERMAMTDPLTGLANRRRLDEATQRFWSVPSSSTLASLILIDVDRFKVFNDAYGHAAGDLCLTTIAKCVAAGLRDTDLAVRFGGEEIVVFLPGTDFIEARQIAESIRLAVIDAAIPNSAIAPDAVVTASLGVATAATATSTSAELVHLADVALYAAKQAGRNQVWPPVSASPFNVQKTTHLALAS